MSSIFSSLNSPYNTSKRSSSPYPNSSKPLASTYKVLQGLLGLFLQQNNQMVKVISSHMMLMKSYNHTHYRKGLFCFYWAPNNSNDLLKISSLLKNKFSFVFHHSNGFLESFNYTTKLQKQHSPTFSKHNAHINPF
jgi:hypothetical protein